MAAEALNEMAQATATAEVKRNLGLSSFMSDRAGTGAGEGGLLFTRA